MGSRRRAAALSADRYARRQAGIATIGRRALAAKDIGELLDDAVRVVGNVLEAEYCKVLQLLPDRSGLRLQAGIGWREGVVGRAVVGIDRDSQAGYTLLAKAPVVVTDLRTEARFSGPPLLHDHGVVSGLSVVIGAADDPFGVLGVHTRRQRTFSADDVHFLEMVADVLAQTIRRAEVADRLNLVLNQLPALLWTTDSELRVTYRTASAAMQRRFHVPDQGTSIIEHLAAADPANPSIEAHLRARAGSSTTFEGNWEARSLYGHVEPLRDRAGNVVGTIGIAEDVTERVEAEKALREALQRHATELEERVAERTAALEETNRELEAFTYTVSHDLRAPVRAMQGFSQALLEDYGDRLDATAREYVTRTVAASARMETLIQDLLAYSRLSRARLEVQPVGLDDVVREALAQVGESAAEVGVQPSLPRVRAHAGTLTQVVANLLGNAVKFVPPGKPARVRVWVERREGRVRLWVEDEGIGIAAEHQERIFRIFERLHGQETYPGTGVGLAIVRKGMERIGGHVGVESSLGQGSRFWVELPEEEAT